jgi:hypothetical protein
VYELPSGSLRYDFTAFCAGLEGDDWVEALTWVPGTHYLVWSDFTHGDNDDGVDQVLAMDRVAGGPPGAALPVSTTLPAHPTCHFTSAEFSGGRGGISSIASTARFITCGCRDMVRLIEIRQNGQLRRHLPYDHPAVLGVAMGGVDRTCVASWGCDSIRVVADIQAFVVRVLAVNTLFASLRSVDDVTLSIDEDVLVACARGGEGKFAAVMARINTLSVNDTLNIHSLRDATDVSGMFSAITASFVLHHDVVASGLCDEGEVRLWKLQSPNLQILASASP